MITIDTHHEQMDGKFRRRRKRKREARRERLEKIEAQTDEMMEWAMGQYDEVNAGSTEIVEGAAVRTGQYVPPWARGAEGGGVSPLLLVGGAAAAVALFYVLK